MLTSIKYILTIAEAERKMLYRKAKFWVLGGGGLIGIIFFMVVMTIVSIVSDRAVLKTRLEKTPAGQRTDAAKAPLQYVQNR